MVNTKESPVFLEKSCTWQNVPRNDAYTVRDGHFIGHDGFIVPASFSEFFQRFPSYVEDWVRRRVRGSKSQSEAEDWTQDLLAHLAVLPMCSKFRRDGKQDVIQTFSPDRMHGASEARFRSFINLCLTNKFNTLYVRWRKRPLSNPGNLSFDVSAEFGVTDEFCHSNSEYLRQAGRRVREQEEMRLRINEFLRCAEPLIRSLKKDLVSFGEYENWEIMAKMLGRRKCDSLRRNVQKQVNVSSHKVICKSLCT